MTAPCDCCQSAAEPAAQMKSFEHEGETLHCLVFVSSCMVCGRRWDDERYAAANADQVEQTRAAMLRRIGALNGIQSTVERALPTRVPAAQERSCDFG